MVHVDIEYEGGLRCRATHAPSGMQLHTDAPTDNHGRGASFSPTDLIATGLATCIATMMGIYARPRNLDLEGTSIGVDKEMASDPRRIARLTVEVHVPHAFDERTRTALQHAAHGCPVHESLHPDTEVDISFTFADEE